MIKVIVAFVLVSLLWIAYELWRAPLIENYDDDD